MRSRTYGLLLIMLAGPAALGAELSIFDGTFAPGDWTMVKFGDTTTNGDASAAAVQASTGGMPGAYREVNHSWHSDFTGISTPAGQGGTYAHLRAGAVWNPATDGAVTGVAFSMDTSTLSAPYFQGPETGLVAVQDGKYFTAASYGGMTLGQGWVSSPHWTLVQDDFTRYGVFPLVERPDFSSAGSPIQFGFFTWGGGESAVLNDLTSTIGVDNFSLTVVPAPGALGVAAVAGLGAVAGRARRRR